ncbi:MAG: hypothetical protein LQ349_000213 [Xanthoria aureola]|nr:MAG: hypothetical protein LQ349_000213 [Xanthoria aureola]
MDGSGPSQHNPYWEQLMPHHSNNSASNPGYSWGHSLDPFSSTDNVSTHLNHPSSNHCNFHNRLCLCRRQNLHPPQNLPGTDTPPSNLLNRESFNFHPPSLPEPRNPHPDASRQLPGIDSFAPYLTSTDHPPSDFSWGSFGDDSLFDSDFWPHLENVENSQLDLELGNSFGDNYFVDLTADAPSSPVMPTLTRKRRASGAAREVAESPPPRNGKRPKLEKAGTGRGKKEVEQLDLVDLHDDEELSKVLERQSAERIKEQQGPRGDVPTKLSNVQCIICMEPMTDMSVTHCGHIFCHTCIMEALIAGENQGEPGKATSKCPVCRKKVARPKEKTKDKREVIPIEIKCAPRTRGSPAKGKGKAKAKI